MDKNIIQIEIKNVVVLAITLVTWLALGPIFKPVQFIIYIINIFTPFEEGSEVYYNLAGVIGLLMILIIYLLWKNFLRKIE